MADDKENQRLMEEFRAIKAEYENLNRNLSMVLKGEFDVLSKKLKLLGRRINRRYKKLSAILDKEK